METANSLKSNSKKILAGFGFGVLFSLLIYLLFAVFLVNNHRPTPSQPTKILNLAVSTPEKNIATSEKTISISGSTGIKSIVTVSLGKQSKIVETAGSYFSTTLNLTEGKNRITIVAFDPSSGLSQTSSREVLYLNEDLTSL